MVDTIQTKKFSQMTNGGDLANNERTPGLLGGDNVLFNNPWTFLPPGTTGDRPTPAADMYYRLRFNTDDQLYEYYDAVLAMWTQLQETLFTAGPYLIYEADPAFPDAFNLGALTSGILKQDVTAGVSTPSIAVNDVDYYGPGMIGFLQAPAGIKDINGNNIITFNAQPLAINYIDLSNNGTGLYPVISAMGPDANIGFTINCKGIGGFLFSTEANTPITIQSGTGRQHNTHLIFPDTLATRDVTFQDSDGTVAYLSDIPSDISNAPFVTFTSDGTLSNEFNLGSLNSGLLKQTVVLGVSTPAIAVIDTDYYGPGMTGYMQAPAGIKDTNGNIVIFFDHAASAVNYLGISNNSTGLSPVFEALGTDTNIGITQNAKGTGMFLLSSENTIPLTIQSGTSRQHATQFSFANTAQTRTVTFQDANGTVAYLSDVAAVVTSITGTANQVIASSPTGAVTLSLPQSINTSSSPTFANLTLTSVNFGGSSLSTYNSEVSWTPTITFATPGDLSVVYSFQFGLYTIIGGICFYRFSVIFTPTFTTASGQLRVAGIGLTCANITNLTCNNIGGAGTLPTFPAGTTTLVSQIAANTNYFLVSGFGSGVATTAISTTQCVSGMQHTVSGSGFFYL